MQCCSWRQPELGKARACCSYLVLVHIFISCDNDALLYSGLRKTSFHSLYNKKESTHPQLSDKQLPADVALPMGASP